jgi:hypothetical protein
MRIIGLPQLRCVVPHSPVTHPIVPLPQTIVDNFEEHFLPDSVDRTGLQLHHINECSRHFRIHAPTVLGVFVHHPYSLTRAPVRSGRQGIHGRSRLQLPWKLQGIQAIIVGMTVRRAPAVRR